MVCHIQSVLEKTGESFAHEENEEFRLQNELYYLKGRRQKHFKDKDAWLNDIMDAAQKLIFKALATTQFSTQKRKEITHSQQLTTSICSYYMTDF